MSIVLSAETREQDAGLLSVIELFHQQVIDTPDAQAVVFEDRELTFAQLNALANQFANALADNDVQPDQCVGLCIDRCPEAIAAMLGAFKVGAVFVPLDPEYPLDRVQYMIDDAQIRVVITRDRSVNRLASRIDQSMNLNWIDSASIEFARLGEDFDPVQIAASDRAYIMYTSGSTGQPKGVQIEHRALTTYCMADIEVYQLSRSDRTLQFSTLNFDIAIEEIFPPLLIGGCVVVRPRERSASANELSAIIREYHITAVHLATAYWHEWVDLMVASGETVPEDLRLVIATGEKVSAEHYRRWQAICEHDVLWCNAYGPTETTVTATVFVPDQDFSGDNMPIGLPLPGYEAFILDARMDAVEEGVTGQLFIGGPALARGYLNRPDLDAKAFPMVELSGRGHTRLYNTGDLARWLPGGNIEFAGRIDHQIKLGSYRIEPGEIEAVANKHPAVLESLVSYDEVKGQKFLIAYVAIGKNEVTVETLANHLRNELPTYMVPARYVLVEGFPKTINGKIDRQALPDPGTSKTPVNGSYAAPRTAMEQKLADIWQAVLHVPQIGIYDDFFALGGSSLLVTRVVTELTTEYDVELPVRDFFANPTVAASARHLERMLGIDSAATDGETSEEFSLARRRQPIVSAQFIGTGSRRLFSVHYQPRSSDSSPLAGPRHGVVMCHALGHEYTRSYRNLQQLAIQLCDAGFDVLRFDYYGTGNSTGNCQSLRAESLQADARKATQYLRQVTHCETMSVVGIRMGATVVATAQLSDVDRIVLWDPVVDGGQFLRTQDQLHDYALTSQTRFARSLERTAKDQAFGYAMTDEKRTSLSHLQLPDESICRTYPGGGPESLIITSRGYPESECGFWRLGDSWDRVSTDDDIQWHTPEFTESAFSSPAAYRTVLEFLREGDGDGR